MEERDRLLTVDDVAAFLGVPKSWIYEKTRHHAIPVYRIGKYCRFSARELQEWLKERRDDRLR